MTRLAAILIVRNEAHSIKAALASVSFADEIVVVDSGSTDHTLEIAKQFTNMIFNEADWQGYGVQRQRAQSKTVADWVLMIDADERISDELRAEIEQVVEQNNQTKAYAMPILPWCFGRFLRHGGWYPAPKVRLYPNSKAKYGPERVHEKLYFAEGMHTELLKGDLLHFTYRDVEHYLLKSARYAREWAEQRHAQGKHASLLQGVLHGIGCFLKIYIIKAGFLDGKQGFLVALLSAHSTFVKYADLWSRSQVKTDHT
jgi:(heptosyl)LPS beta-1,4-glucosyltransferase